MSKLKVSTISDPDNDNTAITVSNTGAVTFAQDATFSGAINGDGSNLTGISGGKILQVQSLVNNNRFSTTSTSFVGQGQTLTFTPLSSTSNILITQSAAVYRTSGGGYYSLMKNGTEISGKPQGIAPMESGWVYQTYCFLEASGSTSSRVYQACAAVSGSNTAYWGWSSTNANNYNLMTVMEIEA